MFLGDLTDLLQEIIVEACKLTKAERCSLFLLDSEHNHLVAKIFDGETSTKVSFVRLNNFNIIQQNGGICASCHIQQVLCDFTYGFKIPLCKVIVLVIILHQTLWSREEVDDLLCINV